MTEAAERAGDTVTAGDTAAADETVTAGGTLAEGGAEGAAARLVTLDELSAAVRRVADVAVHTPLLHAAWAGDLWVKAENLQPIGAFKIRGAYNKIAQLGPAERARGVLAHSSGNHAQAVAYAARRFGIDAVIVMPDVTPEIKVAATRALGAEVVLVPVEERFSRAEEMVAERGHVMVPPFDDRAVIAGQGTVGMEILDDAPDVDVVLVPVSGGGLVSGVAAAVKLRRPQVRVIGVEPELAADARDSLRSGRRVSWPVDRVYQTAADGLRASPVGVLPWAHIQAYVDDIVTVSEAEIRGAVRGLARGSRLVAEPSGAVTTAAHLFRGSELPAGRRVAVLSGGNLEPAAFAEILTETETETDRAGA